MACSVGGREAGEPDESVSPDCAAAGDLLAHEEGNLMQAHRRGWLADGQVDQTCSQLMQALTGVVFDAHRDEGAHDRRRVHRRTAGEQPSAQRTCDAGQNDVVDR
jgi:hypothetical protein